MADPPARALLLLLKSTAGSAGPSLSLPVGAPVEGLLRPVATRPDAQSESDVLCLTEWRNEHVKSFLTEFVATVPQTRRWLAETVGPSDSRILFVVERLDGEIVGYMGLAFIDWDKAYAEADAVVRGRPAQRHLMTRALRAMLAWAASQLSLKTFGVRVRSDNPARLFYEKFGFREVKRVALRKISSDGLIKWEEDPLLAEEGGLTLVHMRLESEQD
jgi:RimJ/RimL family protein N-acetyltransferase